MKNSGAPRIVATEPPGLAIPLSESHMSCCEQFSAHLQRALIEVQFALGDLSRTLGENALPSPSDDRRQDLDALLLARRLLESALKSRGYRTRDVGATEATA